MTETFDTQTYARWSQNIHVFACKVCAREGAAVFFGLHEPAFAGFASNKRKMVCPHCGFTAQMRESKRGKPAALLWLPMNLSSSHRMLTGLPIVRMPQYEITDQGVLSFLDGDPPLTFSIFGPVPPTHAPPSHPEP
jgi:hypothetical protein